jgi:hypothetical protein
MSLFYGNPVINPFTEPICQFAGGLRIQVEQSLTLFTKEGGDCTYIGS